MRRPRSKAVLALLPFTPSPFTHSPSDNFKIAFQLPVGHRFSELAFFPFASRGEVLDERIAERGARGFRGPQSLRCLPKRGRQSALGGRFLIVRVAADRLAQWQLVFNSPQAGSECDCQTQVGIAIGRGDPVFDTLALFRARN